MCVSQLMAGVVVGEMEWRNQLIQPAKTHSRAPEGARGDGMSVDSALTGTLLDTESGPGNARIRVGAASTILEMVLRQGAVGMFFNAKSL